MGRLWLPHCCPWIPAAWTACLPEAAVLVWIWDALRAVGVFGCGTIHPHSRAASAGPQQWSSPGCQTFPQHWLSWWLWEGCRSPSPELLGFPGITARPHWCPSKEEEEHSPVLGWGVVGSETSCPVRGPALGCAGSWASHGTLLQTWRSPEAELQLVKVQAHTSDGDKGLEQRGRSESMAATTSAHGLPKQAVPDAHTGLPHPAGTPQEPQNRGWSHLSR